MEKSISAESLPGETLRLSARPGRVYTCKLLRFTRVDAGPLSPLFRSALPAHPAARRAGTRYTAIAMHADPEGKKKHEEMGFLDGWGTALDQLVELAKQWA